MFKHVLMWGSTTAKRKWNRILGSWLWPQTCALLHQPTHRPTASKTWQSRLEEPVAKQINVVQRCTISMRSSGKPFNSGWVKFKKTFQCLAATWLLSSLVHRSPALQEAGRNPGARKQLGWILKSCRHLFASSMGEDSIGKSCPNSNATILAIGLRL